MYSEITPQNSAVISTEEFIDNFIHLENISAVAHACMEFPFFSLCPPAFDDKDNWYKITNKYPICKEILTAMYKSGFHPLSRDLYLKKTLSNEPCYSNMQKDESHLIVDLDYGIFFYHDNGKLYRLSLDIEMYKRYKDKLPKNIPLKQEEMLDVGAIRGQHLTNNIKKSTTDIVEYSISTRAELDDILNLINQGSKKTPNLEIWYRGQPDDYLMTDYTDEKYEEILPYRKIRDSSLVPSLFRHTSLFQSNYKDYYNMLEETQKYVLGMEHELGISDIVERKENENTKDFFNHSAWGAYDTGMTTTSTDEVGNILSIKDSYPGFFALQKSFFLQHYGLPSPVLDITSSIDVSLFFAQNTIKDDKYQKISFEDNEPVIYIMALDKTLDLFMSSDKLRHHHKLLRPMRQKCGIIAGASMMSRNYYARFVTIKIRLKNFIEYDSVITPEYLFPSIEEDTFLKKLLEIQETENLMSISPFYLK